MNGQGSIRVKHVFEYDIECTYVAWYLKVQYLARILYRYVLTTLHVQEGSTIHVHVQAPCTSMYCTIYYRVRSSCTRVLVLATTVLPAVPFIVVL